MFDVSKYLGCWYELAHYPSWFQRNDNYNTMAKYTMNEDGTIRVHNSTIVKGKPMDSYGTARRMDEYSFRVDFEMPEIENLVNSGDFFPPSEDEMERMMQDGPNYVIEKIWTNCKGQYVFAIVTDPMRESLYILSRYPNPSLVAYNEIMEYVVENFDRDRLVQTPHFK